LWRDTKDFTGVTANTAWHIDRNARQAAFIYCFNNRSGNSIQRPRQTGPKKGINNQFGLIEDR
jgi:hypothetical protein